MSWKGFTKAITRLPHLVMKKTGNAEETRDADFDALEATFERTREATERLLDDVCKYRDALRKVILHQQGAIEAFRDTADAFGEAARRSPASSPPAAAKRGATAASLGGDVSAALCDRILDDLDEVKAGLLGDLDESLSERAIAWLTELVDVQREIAGKIVKRSHKMVDFDRHRHAFKKLAAQTGRSIGEEAKLEKVRAAVRDASDDYVLFNDALKEDLPAFFALQAALMQPVLDTVMAFNQRFHAHQQEAHARSALFPLGGGGAKNGPSYHEILDAYEAQMEGVLGRIGEIPMLQHASGRPTSARPRDGASSVGRRSPLRDGGDDDDHKASHERRPDRKESRQATDIPSQAIAPREHRREGEKAGSHKTVVGELAARLSSARLDAPPMKASPMSTSPPPPPKRRADFVRAAFDFASTEEGDISFARGDLIEVIHRTPSLDDWWTGKVKGRTGSFPANYTEPI